jgi:predicted transcriptional regulator
MPPYQPQTLSLGPLEAEILDWVWVLDGDLNEGATVKDIHDRLLCDPDRELAYASVTTVLNRLVDKGWLRCDRQTRAFRWLPRLSREQAQVIQAQAQLKKFLDLSNPDMMVAFADGLDRDSLDRLDAIADRLRHLRQSQQG